MARRGDLSRAAVLALLGRDGPSSRTSLARTLGLSPAALSAITKDLLARGLVVESAQAPSQGGRPAVLLALLGRPACALGAKVAGDHVTWTWAGLDGTAVATGTAAFDPSIPAPAHALADMLRDVLADPPEGVPQVLGVGVAVPGQVPDRDTGLVTAPTIGWSEVPLGRTLVDRLGIPVLVENDVNALAVAERLYGLGHQHHNFLVVTIGRGIGAALVAEGQVLRGARGGAGEVGHVPVASDGPSCSCGNAGCLEALIGEMALVRAAVADGVLAPGDGHAQLAAAADEGRAGAVTLLAEAGRRLGRVVAGMVNVLDPEAVALLGEGTSAWHHWVPGFEPALRQGLLPARRDLPVVVQDWDDTLWALGAAALVLATPHDAATGSQGEAVRARLTDAALVGSGS